MVSCTDLEAGERLASFVSGPVRLSQFAEDKKRGWDGGQRIHGEKVCTACQRGDIAMSQFLRLRSRNKTTLRTVSGFVSVIPVVAFIGFLRGNHL